MAHEDTDVRMRDVMAEWLAGSEDRDTAALRTYTLAHIRLLEAALGAAGVEVEN